MFKEYFLECWTDDLISLYVNHKTYNLKVS